MSGGFARMENTSADRYDHIIWTKDGDKRKSVEEVCEEERADAAPDLKR